MKDRIYTIVHARYSLLKGYFRGTLCNIQNASNKEELNKVVDKAVAFLDELDVESKTELKE